jgi:hypothetical protein
MGFNQFMTLTSYVFGLGVAIYALRNGPQVASAIGGIWNAGSTTVKNIATI